MGRLFTMQIILDILRCR